MRIYQVSTDGKTWAGVTDPAAFKNYQWSRITDGPDPPKPGAIIVEKILDISNHLTCRTGKNIDRVFLSPGDMADVFLYCQGRFGCSHAIEGTGIKLHDASGNCLNLLAMGKGMIGYDIR